MSRTPETTDARISRTPETMDLAACRAALEAYGYRLDRWAAFESDAPAALVERAREYVPGQHDPHVVWDPDDDEDGWMILSSEPLDMARETCRMIYDGAPETGPLA